jgi:hypothetical protein
LAYGETAQDKNGGEGNRACCDVLSLPLREPYALQLGADDGDKGQGWKAGNRGSLKVYAECVREPDWAFDSVDKPQAD